MKLLYTFGVNLYTSAIRVASLWNPKAKKWLKGRKETWNLIEKWKGRNDIPTHWFHCASLGEFEQARPIIEELKNADKCQIIITFFSPSGFEVKKNYDLADLICYLPIENQKNVNRFLSKIKPDNAFIVKYEFWAKYILQAKKTGVKLYLVSAVFHKKQPFFKWYGGYMRNVLASFDSIFVQDKASQNQLKEINIESVLAGDTRYDRVFQNASNVQPYPEIEKFINSEPVLIIGSSWSEDERFLTKLINSNSFSWKIILAPHEIKENRLREIETNFNLKKIRYSKLKGEEDNSGSYQMLIIDNIGMLMNIYQYGTLAYVGGAFGKGLHNILEPACFGIPVIFGNNYVKFNEAYDFIENRIGYSISDASELADVFDVLKAIDKKEEILSFMAEKRGATSQILSHVMMEKLPVK